ncbi:FMN-dependent alpha-hydroxy acid dehydrogenase [Microthyrium microscopicum]|uniref:FMN-dependent alpha-hydroxy acid dehydrogenase n=1 Tax=Microthyrium microscopicum TaxID=703497 RepID=A0A6A6UBJ3_9PEZI|nr:FMN-dependent alpha-hydroxy acid dehydrogenase [Microthyrium microscopicum]
MSKRSPVDPNYVLPDPTAPGNYQREIYSSLRAPKFSTKPSEWETAARAAVPEANFLYVFGSASSGDTYNANRAAFQRYRLRPRMLINVTLRDLRTTLFGKTYAHPLIVAPIGVQSILHEHGEEATARAAQSVGVPMVLSTAASRTIEQVSKANGDGERWFQLYWPKPQYEDVTISLLKRAQKEGYSTLVVTLDTFTLAWRPNDLDTSYLPFVWGEGCQIGLSDPVFNERYAEQVAKENKSVGEKLAEAKDIVTRPGSVVGALKVLANAATLKKSQAWMDVMNSGTYREWDHLKILRENWSGPIVLKGIQTVEDARLAIQHGMNGIVVSNHGGRQLDGAIASLDALAEITADEEVKSSKLTVLFDSGVRTGSDAIKALALGAKAVLIGRPYAYGLAMGGEEGVKHVLRCMLADLDNQLANLGKKSVEELSRNDLRIMEKL